MLPICLIVQQQLLDGLAAIQPEAKLSTGHLDDIFFGWWDTLPTLAKLKDDKKKWLPTFPPNQIFEAYPGRTVPIPSIAILDEGTESNQLAVGDFLGVVTDPNRTGDVYGERLTTSLSIVLTAPSIEDLHALHSFVHWVLLRNRRFFAKGGLEISRIGQAGSYVPEALTLGLPEAYQKSISWTCEYNDLYVEEYPLLTYDGGLGFSPPGDGGTPWINGVGSTQQTVIAATT